MCIEAEGLSRPQPIRAVGDKPAEHGTGSGSSTAAPTNSGTQTNKDATPDQPRSKRRCTQTGFYQAGTGGMENTMVDDRQNNDPENRRGGSTEVQAFDENENLILPTNEKSPEQSSIIRSEPVVPTTEAAPTTQNMPPGSFVNMQLVNEMIIARLPTMTLEQVQNALAHDWNRGHLVLSQYTRNLLLQRQAQLQQTSHQNSCYITPQAYDPGQALVGPTDNNNPQTGPVPPGAYHSHQNTNQIDNQLILMTQNTATHSTNPNLQLPDSVTQTMIVHTDGMMPLTTGN